MPTITPDTVLQRASSMKLSLDSAMEIAIAVNGVQILGGPHALSILDAFSRPTRVSAAMETLRPRLKGAHDWMDLMGEIRRLHQAGALAEEGNVRPALAVFGSFNSAPIHVKMLNDRARTTGYLNALREVVRPGDVVVDVGTGTGILAMAAARAGASRVYAVEASDIGKSAQAIFKANGFGDRITLIQGWSTRIELPERADVMVSEIIGNDPLGENVLAVTADARKRLLKPDARLIPNRLRVFGVPITIGSGKLESRTFNAENTKNWKSWYGFDFSSLIDISQENSTQFIIKPSIAYDWETFAQPVLLADLDLTSVDKGLPDISATFTATASGKLNGLVICFDTDLSPSFRLSTAPREVSETNSWRSPVWILSNPLDVNPGDRLVLSYKYGRGGDDRVDITRD
jgi:hypothetical protein